MMLILGSFNTFSLLIESSREISNEGSRIRLASIANNSVTDTKPPSATVPPKLEVIKTANPKNRTMEV